MKKTSLSLVQQCVCVGFLVLSVPVFSQPATPPPCANVSSNLVDWWPGNGNANDVVGNDNGTTTNITYDPGEVGEAFSFNGTDSEVNFGANAGNFGASDFTIDFWINTISPAGLAAILEKRPECDSSASYWNIRYDHVISTGYLVTALGSGQDQNVSRMYTATTINDGRYHHVALTREGLNLTWYIDGAYNTNITSPGIAYLSNNVPLIAGRSVCEGHDGTVPFAGDLDEIDLWSRALSPAEIQAIYNAGSSGKCAQSAPPPPPSQCANVSSNLVDWWPGNGNANDAIRGDNGTTTNITYDPGEVGQAFSFNGTDSEVNFGANAGNFGASDFTIDFWINTTSPAGLAAIIEKRAFCDSSDSYWNIRYDHVISTGYLVTALGSGEDQNVSRMYTATTINDGRYHHVALTRQGLNLTWYIDGAYNTNITSPGIAYLSNSVPLIAGRSVCEGFDGTVPFAGDLDEIDLWSRALSQAEIQAIYDAGSGGKCGQSIPAQSKVQIVDTSGAPGASIVVPVDLVALGIEAGVGFSVDFDPSVLTFTGVTLASNLSGATLAVNSNQMASGQLGMAIAMFNGTFSAGTQRILNISFQIAPGTNATSTTVSFGNIPAEQQVSDFQAHILAALFVPGVVSITSGVEGDVAPRPNGDEATTVIDWIQEGRFVVGLDVPAIGSEFQRADCAPRATLGDGQINVADWVQLGRYIVGLDPLTPAGGPTGPLPSPVEPAKTGSGRPAMLVPLTQGKGMSSVAVQLLATGSESAFQFSVKFDPAMVRYVNSTLGSGAPGAALIENTNQISSGNLGFAVGLLPPAVFASGAQELVKLNFTSVCFSNNTTVAFSDSPVERLLVDSNSVTLPVTCQDAALAVAGSLPPNLAIDHSGNTIVVSWPATATALTLQTAPSLSGPWNTVVAPYFQVGDSLVSTIPNSTNTIYFRLKY